MGNDHASQCGKEMLLSVLSLSLRANIVGCKATASSVEGRSRYFFRLSLKRRSFCVMNFNYNKGRIMKRKAANFWLLMLVLLMLTVTITAIVGCGPAADEPKQQEVVDPPKTS